MNALARQLLFETVVTLGVPMALVERWRELCERVVNETDPDKLISLTHQLIIALDERKPHRSGSAKDWQDEFFVDDFAQFIEQQ